MDNQINAIYNDDKGKVWLGTNGGFSVYDGKEFKNYPFKDELAENSVLSITKDRFGNMWFATDGGGMVYFNSEKLNYITLPNGVDNNYVRNVTLDNKGLLWLATRNGVATIDSDFNIKNEIDSINATQIFIDGDVVWCSTFGDGMLKLVNNTCVKLKSSNGLISDHILSLIHI